MVQEKKERAEAEAAIRQAASDPIARTIVRLVEQDLARIDKNLRNCVPAELGYLQGQARYAETIRGWFTKKPF